ncbi:early nodulin-like protein 5 [Actinidia rufa]|uniref:Early nodulin-like protein 5 n=1 Tax=Actinidia rufa TaxID=165716 RepID=A0A7J0H7T4_9ERIC|nr:early nodulin-like protein 5 [Actinidia rufa]
MLLFLTLSVLAVTSFEFQVGDTNGWIVHPPMSQKFTMTGPPRTASKLATPFLDRSGPFYFISGSSGHCSRGQRMIVNKDSQSGSCSSSSGSSAAAVLLCGVVVARLAFSNMF